MSETFSEARPIVLMDDVHKSFGAIPVLRGVSFHVDEGQIVALIGASGSGKSTALRCIERLEKIDGGRIEVCGLRVDDPGLNLRRLHLDVGIVFQQFNLFPHLTILQNICLAPVIVKKMSKLAARELGRDMLVKVGLEDKIHAYPEQLSGGQQQRAAIARSLAMQPKVMLFDEVTSALDPKLTGEVLRVIENLVDEGMTMIMVTHEMNFARKIADKIIFMHQGVVRESGDASILTTPQTTELAEFMANEL